MFAHAFSFTDLYDLFKSSLCFCFVLFCLFLFLFFLLFGNKETKGLKTYLEQHRYSEILYKELKRRSTRAF